MVGIPFSIRFFVASFLILVLAQARISYYKKDLNDAGNKQQKSCKIIDRLCNDNDDNDWSLRRKRKSKGLKVTCVGVESPEIADYSSFVIEKFSYQNPPALIFWQKANCKRGPPFA